MKRPREPLPLFVRLEGRRVLVVGGGEVAARKARELVAAGARVELVAPRVSAAIAAMPELAIATRRFAPADVEGAWLVVAATDDARVNADVVAAAESRRVLVNAAGDPERATALFAAVVRRPPFVVAISSGGDLPALSRLVREIVESALPGDDWVRAARALRRRWRDEGVPPASRFADLVRRFAERARRARGQRDASR